MFHRATTTSILHELRCESHSNVQKALLTFALMTIGLSAAKAGNQSSSELLTVKLKRQDAPQVTLSATNISFGSVAVGNASVVQNVMLTNTGQKTLSLSSIMLSGTNASAFSLSTTCGGHVQPGANCTISAIFTPSALAAESAAINVIGNQPNSPSVITLSGTGTGTAKLALSTPAVTFGNVVVGQTSATITVALANIGTANLAITSVTMTGSNSADFSFSNTCGSLISPGATCNISVTFMPSLVGAESSLLSIAGNQSGSPSTVTLSGTGVSQPITPLPIVGITSGVTASVTEGAAIQFTAPFAATWSLAPGSAGTIDQNGVYTAPAQITAKNVSGGCQNSPNDSVFNTRIDTLPVHANSATWIASLVDSNYNPVGIFYEQDWGLSTFTSNTPAVNLMLAYTPQYNGGYQIPSFPNLHTENGNNASGYGGLGGDHHISAANIRTCQFFDIYDYTPGQGIATSAVSYSGLSEALPSGGTDAAGMYLQPLTLRLAELENGHINHALRFSMSNNYIAPAFVWPASTNAFPYAPNGLPYGSRLRLKAGAVNVSTLSPMAQTLVTQLMQYGGILADGGASVGINTDQDLKEDPSAISALHEAAAAVDGAGGMSLFEVVDESALQDAAASQAVKIGNTANVTPDNFAQVIATDANGNKYTLRVALQGVGIAVSDASVTVASGATVQLQATAIGATMDNSVIWQSASAGTLTASGSFVAPTVTAPTRVTAVIASTENPTATQTVVLNVLPLASDGSLRVAEGMGTNYSFGYPGLTYTDPNGLKYWPEPGFLAGDHNYCDWGGAGGGLFNPWCNFGPDVTHNVLLPKGNYRVDVFIGVPSSLATRQGSYNVGAQGQWTSLGFNPITASNGGKQPITLSIPAQVGDDNRLSWTISDTQVMDTNFIGPMLSGWAVTPDSSAPRLAISDANGNTSTSTVATNTTMQFSAIGWYMSNAITWSMSPAIGSISSTGLYTAPTVPQTATITVTATSTVDNTKTASMTINLIEGTLAINANANPIARGLSDQFSAGLNGIIYSNITWSASLGTIDPKTGAYLAPDSLPANTTAIITATSNDDPKLSATYTLNLLANINPIRINTGDWYEPVTDGNGYVWSTDWGAVGGSVYHGNFDEITGLEIDGQPLNATSPMVAVYGSSRYSAYTATNSFDYNFTLPNGNYHVTLLFCNWGDQAHTRLFNVSANATQVISNYDPDANGVGVASSQTFTAPVTNKTLTLSFTGLNGALAEVNAIQIVPAN
jgi:hypothetical protein